MKSDRNAVPLDAEETLFVVGSKEVWQSRLVTSDGEEIGPVVRQVVEPQMYTIRYFVVYDLREDRHVLVPANTVTDITASEVQVDVSSLGVAQMPAFHHEMSRCLEKSIYDAIGRTPHWVEEARFGASAGSD